MAFVVENPTVLAALIKHVHQFAPESHPTLICTNGNLKLADKALLDALVQRGAHLFYGGDFEGRPPGGPDPRPHPRPQPLRAGGGGAPQTGNPTGDISSTFAFHMMR